MNTESSSTALHRNFISVQRAAEHLDGGMEEVFRLVQVGALPTAPPVGIGGGYYVDEETVLALAVQVRAEPERAKPARPARPARSRTTKRHSSGSPGAARTRTLPQLRAAGVRTAGDEALENAAAAKPKADETQRTVDAILRHTVLRRSR